jgi:hypothetical protein
VSDGSEGFISKFDTSWKSIMGNLLWGSFQDFIKIFITEMETFTLLEQQQEVLILVL